MDGLTIFKDYFNRIRREIILNSYYMQKVKNGKTMRASFLDWIFITVAIGIFFLVNTFNSTKHILISIILTGLLMLIYLFILLNWKAKTRIKNITNIKEIAKYSNDDFLLYVKNLLEKYYKTTFFEFDYNIDFIGEINEEIYGVKCFKNSLENKIALKDIENYIVQMKEKNIQEGIIVTNSYFSDEVKEKTNYLLIDFNQIIEMLVETKQFPSHEQIEDIIIEKYRDKRKNLKGSLSFHRKDKIYKFILLGIGLYIVSSHVAYPLYRRMAFISILSGLIIGVYNLIEYFKRTMENRI